MRSLFETKQALDRKEISSVELIDASLKTIEQWEPHISAFVEVLIDEAREEASKWDKKRSTRSAKQDLSTAINLGGIPIGIKDVICTLEGHTQAASNMLRDFRSPYEATAVAKLKAAGGITIGKVNCDAYAMGSSTEYSDFAVTKNPWDTSLVPGGSSGGSAAAVITDEVTIALGTDTGGSVRHPSSFCNTVGLRPTYGRISRFGVIAYGSSLDQIGPITRSVEDTALMLQILAGADARDATSSPEPVGNYLAACHEPVKNLKIGIPQEYFGDGITPAVAYTVHQAIAELKKLGAEIIEVNLPLTAVAVPVYYLIAKSEGSTNLSRYDAIRYGHQDINAEKLLDHYIESRGSGFGPEVKRTILMGTYALSSGYYDAWYKQASKVRQQIRQEFDQVFTQVDVIVGPTVPEVAFPIGTKADDPLAMYMTDALVVAQPLAGIPVISIPAGFVDGLPVGMQIMAPHFKEELLFTVGHSYQQSTDWHLKQPKIPKKK